MKQLVYNKILTTQAIIDSLPLADEEVEDELTRKSTILSALQVRRKHLKNITTKR